MSYIINSEYELYSYENFASIYGENDIKYEFGIDSSELNQEPVSRDCQAITTVCCILEQISQNRCISDIFLSVDNGKILTGIRT